MHILSSTIISACNQLQHSNKQTVTNKCATDWHKRLAAHREWDPALYILQHRPHVSLLCWKEIRTSGPNCGSRLGLGLWASLELLCRSLAKIQNKRLILSWDNSLAYCRCHNCGSILQQRCHLFLIHIPLIVITLQRRYYTKQQQNQDKKKINKNKVIKLVFYAQSTSAVISGRCKNTETRSISDALPQITGLLFSLGSSGLRPVLELSCWLRFLMGISHWSGGVNGHPQHHAHKGQDVQRMKLGTNRERYSETPSVNLRHPSKSSNRPSKSPGSGVHLHGDVWNVMLKGIYKALTSNLSIKCTI